MSGSARIVTSDDMISLRCATGILLRNLVLTELSNET